MNHDETPELFQRLQAEDSRQERRLFWAELLALALVLTAACAHAWFIPF